MADKPTPGGNTGAESPSPHERPEIWGPRLLRIVEQQVEQFRELDQLSRDQAALIKEGRSDELLALLGSRQVIVDRITSSNGELEPFLASWDTLSEQLPAALRESVRARMRELEELVASIAARDQADQKALEERRGGVQNELASLSRNRSAVNAYASTGVSRQQPHYQDRQG